MSLQDVHGFVYSLFTSTLGSAARIDVVLGADVTPCCVFCRFLLVRNTKSRHYVLLDGHLQKTFGVRWKCGLVASP